MGARLHDGRLPEAVPAGDSEQADPQLRTLHADRKAEQDDNCGKIYHKSLLYLVSHAFEKRLREPSFGNNEDDGSEPILGMAKFVNKLPKAERPSDWVLAPNARPAGRDASAATAHGAFDDDQATLQATLARILGKAAVAGAFRHGRSGAANRDRRAALSSRA